MLRVYMSFNNYVYFPDSMVPNPIGYIILNTNVHATCINSCAQYNKVRILYNSLNAK